MAIVLQAQLLLDPGNQIAHLTDFTNLVHETEYLISAPYLQADTRFTFLGYFDIALTRPPLNVPMAQTEVPATISDVPMPAAAQPPSTYPYGDNDRLDWDYLNWGFEFNANGTPPHGSKGGAGGFNQWIDVSNLSAPILRQCIVTYPGRATAGIYVPAEWITLGQFDIPNRNFFFNGGDVGFVNGLSIYGDLQVSGTILGNLGPMPYLPLSGGTLTGHLSGTSITANGVVNTTTYQLYGVSFASRDGVGNNILYDYGGAAAIYLGANNTHRAAGHYFQNKDGSAAGDLNVGYITAAGNITLTAPAQLHVGGTTYLGYANVSGNLALTGTAQLSVNGITNLSYVNVSGNVALTGSAALSVAGISTLGVVNASGNVTTTGSAQLTAGGSAGFSVSTGNTTLRATTINGTTALNGSVSIQGNTTCLGVSQLTVGGNGVFQSALTCNGTIYYGALSALSDAIVKSDVAPYTVGLDAIKQLDPVSFTYIPELKIVSGVKYGLMADDVRPVIPEMVGETEIEIDGVPQMVATIAPDHLWYVLINAVKELAVRVEALETQP